MLDTRSHTLLSPETLLEMTDRIEEAMRPLSVVSPSPDHNRVRELYAELLSKCPGDALTRARRAVLYDILYTAMTASVGE